jgi:capsular polysaccharide transport system permease protein
MTNIITPKLGVDPKINRRAAVDQMAKEAASQLKLISTSRPFVAFVIISGLVLALYYFIMAAPLYVSQTSFQVRGREGGGGGAAAAAMGLLGAIGGGGGSPSTDMSAIEKYDQSYDMAQKLDQRFHLREIYSRPRLDFLYWMPRNASREDFLSFYRKMVKIRTDPDAGTITVDVRAFDPVLAQQMAQAITEISADYINGLSAAVRRDTVRSSEQELVKAEEGARQARLAMTAYQTSTGSIDPLTAAASTSSGMAGMQQQILQARTEMAALLSVNTPNSAPVMQVRARIAGLEQQIVAEQKRIADTAARDNITQRLREFEGLQITSEYAEKQLVAALTAYDAAKSLASERERFIVPVIAPNLPQTATEPHRFASFFEALFVLVAVYGVVALAIAGIRDHQGI